MESQVRLRMSLRRRHEILCYPTFVLASTIFRYFGIRNGKRTQRFCRMQHGAGVSWGAGAPLGRSLFPLTQFLLENDLATKVQIFRLGHLIDISLKVNEMSLSLQERKQTVFVAHNEIRAFMWEWKCWKMCHRYCELDSFPIIGGFSDEIGVCVNIRDMMKLRHETSDHLEGLYKSASQYLINDNAWYHIIKGQWFSCKKVWKIHWYGFSFHIRTHL